jgi:hypothetical protein
MGVVRSIGLWSLVHGGRLGEKVVRDIATLLVPKFAVWW